MSFNAVWPVLYRLYRLYSIAIKWKSTESYHSTQKLLSLVYQDRFSKGEYLFSEVSILYRSWKSSSRSTPKEDVFFAFGDFVYQSIITFAFTNSLLVDLFMKWLIKGSRILSKYVSIFPVVESDSIERTKISNKC